MKEKVFIVGHRNPDTDSICSAISYAYLKNKIGEYEYLPMRAGVVSPETQFVLDYFKMDAPKLLEDLRSQVKDTPFATDGVIKESTSLKVAWEKLTKSNLGSLAVVDEENNLTGVIATKDITKAFVQIHSKQDMKLNMSLTNIVDVLNGTIIYQGENSLIKTPKVIVADDNAKLVEKGNIVILSNKKDIQLEAIQKIPSCMIVSLGAKVSSEVLKFAQEHSIHIVSTNKDSFQVAQLIAQGVSVSHFATKDNLKYFCKDEFLVDVKKIVAEHEHRSYPVVDKDNKVLGIMQRGHLLQANSKKVIMVDHNERRQGVNGMREAEILEILDHHKIGNINTVYPIFFRNRKVGCSCTIIYGLYKENNIEIPKNIAGLMCSAILSDTLLFKSPTCTIVDIKAVEELSKIAGIVPEDYAMAMFEAGSDFSSKTTEELFNLDFKKFSSKDIRYGVAQISSVSRKALDELKENLITYMKTLQSESDDLDMLYLMLTDIINETTEFVCVGQGALGVGERAFNTKSDNGISMFLEKTVSRKKQIIPALSEHI